MGQTNNMLMPGQGLGQGGFGNTMTSMNSMGGNNSMGGMNNGGGMMGMTGGGMGMGMLNTSMNTMSMSSSQNSMNPSMGMVGSSSVGMTSGGGSSNVVKAFDKGGLQIYMEVSKPGVCPSHINTLL